MVARKWLIWVQVVFGGLNALAPTSVFRGACSVDQIGRPAIAELPPNGNADDSPSVIDRPAMVGYSLTRTTRPCSARVRDDWQMSAHEPPFAC